MLRKIVIALCSLAMVAATFAVVATPRAQAQGDSGLRLVSEFIIGGSRFTKFPKVAAGRNQVTVSSPINKSVAVAWNKVADATSFANPFELGEAEGQPDWSTTSVAIGPDGSFFVAWANQPERTVYLRQRTPDGQWGPRRTVENRLGFGVNPEVAVTSGGQVFVAWRDVDKPLRYRFSNDAGANWSERRDLTDTVAYKGAFGMAGGPNGKLGIAFTAGFDDKLQIFVSQWNGSGFNTSRITSSGGDFADPTIAWNPNGRPIVAYRGVANSGGNAGVFFAEQQADGNWPISRLVGGGVVDSVSVSTDEQGNVHMAWVGTPSGNQSLYYAFKPFGGAFRGPIASGNGGAIFNPDLSASVAKVAFGHAVAEDFNGSAPAVRYSLFSSNAFAFGGEPTVENGAARVAPAADGTVLLTFKSLTGSPNQVRWRWNAAPTDAANDSGGWQAFSNERRIAVPDSIRNSTSCQPVVLYTQLRNTTTGIAEPEARPVTVNVDGVVEAQVYTNNPFSRASASELQANPSLAATSGAAGGAPNYTRVPLTWLNVVADSDCSGITVADIGSAPDKFEQTIVVGDGAFAGVVALPDLINVKAGPVPFFVRVRDGAGNSRVYNIPMVFDETKPTYKSGAFTAAGSPDGDILQDLTFSSVSVEDAYPGGYWGVWLANSPTAVADPANDSKLQWTVREAPELRPNSGFTIKDWSLATGIAPADLKPGEDYYIYARFLDGAGNPTDQVISFRVASSQLVRPKTNLPQVRK